MKTKLAALALLSAFASVGAQAECPQIEGRYSYRCTLTRDSEADFGAMIETTGQMIVEQQGCDLYRFVETAKHEDRVIDLNGVDSTHLEWSTKIKKSTDKTLKLKSQRGMDDTGLGDVVVNILFARSYVTKTKISTTRSGFKISGKEKTKTFAIFGARASKFDCKFDRI